MAVVAFPSGITLDAGPVHDGDPTRLGIAFTVTQPTILSGVHITSPVDYVNAGVRVELWENNVLVASKADLFPVTGENFLAFDAPYTLAIDKTYAVSAYRGNGASNENDKGLFYRYGQFPNGGTYGNFVFPAQSGRFVYTAPADPPLGVTNLFFGISPFIDEVVVQPTPVLTVAASADDSSVVAGTLVTLTATPAGTLDAVTYSWAKTSGPSATLSATTGNVVTFTPESAGTYIFTVTATDSDETASATVEVVVTPAPPGAEPTFELWVKDEVGAWRKIGGESASSTTREEGVFYVDDYIAPGATDHTPGINAAIAAAVAAAPTYNNTAVVKFSARHYVCSSPPIVGGATLGNAQIPLPVVPDTGQKLTLVLQGVGPGSKFAHWKQAVPTDTGTVIETTLTNQVVDPNGWSVPSVIGGPTYYQDQNGFRFTNVMLTIDGILIQAPWNPSVIAYDLRHVGQVSLGDIGAIAKATVQGAGGYPNMNDRPTNTNGVGLYMPLELNNARSQVRAFSAEGFYVAGVMSEHGTADSWGAVLCHIGLVVRGSGKVHGVVIQYACIEACDIYIQSSGADRVPLVIGLVNGEGEDSIHIDDAPNRLYGSINFDDIYTIAPNVVGGAHLQITNLRATRGIQVAPALPASGVALRNPFWRDATVNLVGGTVTGVSLNGTNLGPNPGSVLVPSGQTIAVTYSSAPTWVWNTM